MQFAQVQLVVIITLTSCFFVCLLLLFFEIPYVYHLDFGEQFSIILAIVLLR